MHATQTPNSRTAPFPLCHTGILDTTVQIEEGEMN